MKIEEFPIEVTTIEAFAEKYDLVMEVHERPKYAGHPEQFYACFKNAEIKRSIFLCGAYGNGSTPQAAIAAYAEEIQFKVLVIGGNSERELQISVPRLKSALYHPSRYKISPPPV